MMQQRQPFPGGEFCSQPQPPFNNDNHDLRSSFENSHPNAHPHKRPRNSQTINTNLPNLATLPPPVLKSNHSTIPVNRGTTHIFYKTRMCQKFLEGNCRNGDKCTFAHGSKDLREPPPNWQELVKENRGGSGGETWIDDQRIIQKMKICRKFYNGEECPYGGKCNFLHESPAKFKADSTLDMGRTRGNSRESSVINVQTMGPHMDQRIGGGQIDVVQPMDNIPDAIRLSTMSSDTDVVRPSMKAVYWKTRICSKWEATGQCPYGDRCHYAHGLAELHIPIGCIEADGHPYAAGSIMAKGLNVTVPEVLPADAAISTPGGQQGEGRGWARLAHKKLNRIYADWIDDQEDEQVTPNKVD